MRNKIELTAEPGALFLNPWQEEGLKLLRAPDFISRPFQTGIIEGFAVSAHDEMNAKIEAFVAHTQRHKRATDTVEINVVPAVLDHASFRKSHVLAGEKLVLSGASATRLINAFRWENEALLDDPAATLNSYLEECRAQNAGRTIAVEQTFIEPDLDFAIECRNTFNYYHFITESLSQLCVLDEVGFQGNVYFHFPNPVEKHRAFADAFVAALFPEFQGRVFFERAPKEYDVVLSSFDFAGAVGQLPESDLLPLRPYAKDAGRVEAQQVIGMNSVSSALIALRARALKAIEGQDFSHLPTRFFVGRSEGESRDRPLEGQNLLLEHLTRFGFRHVVFENLTPLEQIALMARAEVMISNHGAGFTNMMFAAPDAYVIELGTLQTAQFRWSDFWPLAHVSGCRYINFFADFNSDTPLIEPHFGTDGIVPTALSEAATAQVVAFVVAVLGHAPRMPDVHNLIRLGSRVLQAGAAREAIGLLERHKEMVMDSGALCLLLADCHKALDEPSSELLALEHACKVDPARWQTLVRIIWCANRCKRPSVIRWALDRLRADFPERHDAFVSNHEWVRFVA